MSYTPAPPVEKGLRLSGLPMGGIVLTGAAVPAGSIQQLVDLSGAVLYDGSDWWGVPGSGQPLGLTKAADGLHYPAALDDMVLDIYCYGITLKCGAADAGKLVQFYCNGWWGSGWELNVPVQHLGAGFDYAVARISFPDYLFKGDTGKKIQFFVGASTLTAPATLDMQLQVVARANPR